MELIVTRVRAAVFLITCRRMCSLMVLNVVAPAPEIITYAYHIGMR